MPVAMFSAFFPSNLVTVAERYSIIVCKHDMEASFFLFLEKCGEQSLVLAVRPLVVTLFGLDYRSGLWTE